MSNFWVELEQGVMMELEDLSEGKLAKTKIHENLESVVGKTDILLILDENDIKPEQSRVEVFFQLFNDL